MQGNYKICDMCGFKTEDYKDFRIFTIVEPFRESTYSMEYVNLSTEAIGINDKLFQTLDKTALSKLYKITREAKLYTDYSPNGLRFDMCGSCFKEYVQPMLALKKDLYEKVQKILNNSKTLTDLIIKNSFGDIEK